MVPKFKSLTLAPASWPVIHQWYLLFLFLFWVLVGWARNLLGPGILDFHSKNFKVWCDFFIVLLGSVICSHVHEKKVICICGFYAQWKSFCHILNPRETAYLVVHGSSWHISVSIPCSRGSPTTTTFLFFPAILVLHLTEPSSQFILPLLHK